MNLLIRSVTVTGSYILHDLCLLMLLNNELFDKTGPKYPMQLTYLDIPYMYARTERGMEFIQALVDDSIRKDDVSLFGLASVQIIIDYHERYWFKRNLFFFGLPLTL